MLPPSVEEAIEGIGSDRTSGASRLARVAVETMALLVLEGGAHKDPVVLAEAARRLSEAQPAMAIIHNVVHLFARLVGEGQDPFDVLREIRSELDTARERIGRTFLKIAPERATVLTLSHSESVRSCLLAAHGRRRIERVLVLESRPELEGRAMAAALNDDGIPVSIVPDAEGPALAQKSTYVLVGADSVLRDGSVVNKVGSRPIADAAAANGKAFYVACETLKFDARHDAVSWPVAARNPDELFDVTPASLITTVVTERGTYTPETIRTMLSPGKRSK